MSTELELKFLMTADAVSLLGKVLNTQARVSHTAEHQLLNAYFDTDDKWFRQQDMGLRSRQKNAKFEQTIKLAGKQHGAMQMRPEYNVSCAGVVPQLSAFPAEIWPADTDITALQQQLTELFRTDFYRKTWQLQYPDGTEIELAYDCGQVIAGDKQQPIAELELEFIRGDAQQLFVLARQLIQQLPLRTGWLSKAARGYYLRSGQPLSLPAEIGGTLAQQLNSLQQAEACFSQQQESPALKCAVQALTAIAGAVHEIDGLQQWHKVALTLADMLQNEPQVFASEQYNMLLLALTEHLYHQH